MPLRVEQYNPYSEKNQWEEIHIVYPGDKVTGFDKFNPDGPKEVFLFECEPDDSECIIYMAKPALDVSWPDRRLIATPYEEDVEIYKRLQKGEEALVEGISENGQDKRLIRLTSI